MSEKNNKNILIFAGVIAVAIIVGGFVYAQQKDDKTVSIKVGGKEISASISE
jgi:hypothetical protein